MHHCRRRRLGLPLLAGQPARAAVSPFLRPPSARLATLSVSKWHPVGGQDSADPPRNRQERRGSGARRPAGWAKTAWYPVPLPPKRSQDFSLGSQKPAAAGGPWLGFPVLGNYLGKYILSQEYFLKHTYIYIYALNICLEKHTALPPRLSCPKHRSKPGLKSFPVKSYKSSLIINLQRKGRFLFRIYLSLKKKKAAKQNKQKIPLNCFPS